MTIDEYCEAADIDVPVMEPRSIYDAALVGLVDDGGRIKAAYDYVAVVEKMMQQENWTADEVEEWLSYNALGTFAFMVWRA